MTIRRDLRELSKDNIVTLIPGGAVLKKIPRLIQMKKNI